MSYVVFARKYRPQLFDEVVAQEHITRTLRNALCNNRIASGYLFCGPRGTGKTTIARLLAKAINCADGPTETPCGRCPACVEITSGNSLDVLEIDAASNTGVDDIRALRENVRYLPTHGKKRIFIIDEVHRLSGSAFDALLKTLEEPPEHVMFVMATTEPLKVPDTILSRTQRFDFRRVSVNDLSGHLKNIADKEKLEFEPAALTLIARKADGSVRDSLSLLDQVAAFAGEKVTEGDVVQALGLVDRAFLFDFVESVAATERGRALSLTKSLFDGGIDVSDFVKELLEHLRTIMVLKADPASGAQLELEREELEPYQTQAEFFQLGDLLRLIKITTDLYDDLRSGIDPRLLLETAAVKMAEMESTVRFEEILEHLKRQSGAPASGTPNGRREPDLFNPARRASDQAASPALPESKESAPSSSRPVNLPMLQSGWENFLTVLKKSSPMLASQMRMAELRAVKDNQLQMFFAASGEASLELVSKPENLKMIQQALRDCFRTGLSARFAIDKQKAEPEDGNGSKTPKVDPKQLVDSSPRLKSLLDKVDGEIIGVKKAED